jgi:Ca2+-binding RTX toxin-like protein
MAGDDVLSGGSDRNTLWGGAGNDTLSSTGSGGEAHQGEYKDIEKFISVLVPHP